MAFYDKTKLMLTYNSPNNTATIPNTKEIKDKLAKIAMEIAVIF